jgi:oligoendopeptidase F
LSRLFPKDEKWDRALTRFQRKISGYAAFRGKLADDVQTLATCLKLDSDLDRLGERLGTYASLKTAEDQTNSTYQRMLGRYENAATRAAEAASYIRPEILAIPKARMTRFLATRELKPYRRLLERLLRYRKHTLGKKEEKLLAMQGEMSQAARRAFRQLLDSDMKFGTVKGDDGHLIELTHATFMQLLRSPRRRVRKTAFHQYYEQFKDHQNTLAATLGSSIQKDVYYARVRGYPGSLAAALYPDNVPRSVYDNLIVAVRRRLPALYRYYDLRRRRMKLPEIHPYDTYVPILADLKTHYTWNQAVKTIVAALHPLGDDYCAVLEQGLMGRWCDRYPNRGKQSGAFSCGSYDGDPYILMNYKPEVLDDVFTLAHEAGHSMHTYFSARHQSYLYYDYTIFVAEVASTFNEQLLSHHLMAQARDDRHRAYLINRSIDAIRGTIYRQTMFAEFEKITHEMEERGEPLTLQSLTDVYGQLLSAYFGPDFVRDDELSLECLRIPHFYRAFYVYKYATGMSAAIALAQRVQEGGPAELDDYLTFLKSGCTQDPLDLLRAAGVDMTRPEPVDTALDHFEQLVDELDHLL